MQDQSRTGQGGTAGSAGDVSEVHVFESPGSTEFGFTCDPSGSNLPAPKGSPWKHWRTVQRGAGAEPEVGVDPGEIRDGIRRHGYFLSIITDMPTI